jgi:hypothetical protein
MIYQLCPLKITDDPMGKGTKVSIVIPFLGILNAELCIVGRDPHPSNEMEADSESTRKLAGEEVPRPSHLFVTGSLLLIDQ